jgi:SAM-dependent methyltransferase
MSSGQLRDAWAVIGVKLSDEAWPWESKDFPVRVWKCGDCAFEFSNPEFAGEGQFYKELQAQNSEYYPGASAEFLRAVKFAQAHKLKNVLDVGCGSGSFLNLMKNAGLDTHGVELNPEGARMARANGHKISECFLEELPTDRKFDFVTAWQVVEHVSDPVDLVRQAAGRMSPNGYLGIAVPNETTMRWICPYDPHGWPPHHISRWRLRDLQRLGEQCGLRLIESGAEPLQAQMGKHFWLLHCQLSRALGFKGPVGGAFLTRVFWRLYRLSGAEKFSPFAGSSIYAFYSRQ